MSRYIDADELKSKIINTPTRALDEVELWTNDTVMSVIKRQREILDMIDKMHATEARCWIPADKRLPENAKDRDAFRPKYQIYTSFGITEGWYGWSGNASGWYALIWFMDGRHEEWIINFERGDIPKVAFIPNGGEVKVYAWRELPKPPKMDGGGEE